MPKNNMQPPGYQEKFSPGFEMGGDGFGVTQPKKEEKTSEWVNFDFN